MTRLSDESIPLESPLEGILPYLDTASTPVEGSVSKSEALRFFEFEQLPGESTQDFILRQICETLLGFYSIEPGMLQTPIRLREGAPDIPGVLVRLESTAPNYAPLQVSLDFQNSATPYECRFVVSVFPDVFKCMVPDLCSQQSFFNVLPRSCAFQSWEYSKASTDSCHIFFSYVLAPPDLFTHVAVDTLIRVSTWLRETHSYIPVEA